MLEYADVSSNILLSVNAGSVSASLTLIKNALPVVPEILNTYNASLSSFSDVNFIKIVKFFPLALTPTCLKWADNLISHYQVLTTIC